VTDDGYRLEPVEALGPAAMAGLRRIYEEGFPPHQRAGFDAVTGQRREGEIALALTGAGLPRGFAMLRPLGGTGWVYLRYFVVGESQRGQGLGGLLWDRLTAWLREAGFTLLVFDVDDPDEPGCGPDEAVTRSRRIRFYQRHGASLLPVTGYRTPHATAAGPGWTPMRLMAARLSGEQAPGARAIVEAVYRFRWQLGPGHLPAFRVQDAWGSKTDGEERTWPLTSS
jgi:GNAT superfamily N-acetyltransferase